MTCRSRLRLPRQDRAAVCGESGAGARPGVARGKAQAATGSLYARPSRTKI